MKSLKAVLFLFIGVICLGGIYMFSKKANELALSTEYKKEITSFREKSELNLRSDTGWLTVVGLHWMKEGQFKLGLASNNGEKNQILIPDPQLQTTEPIETFGEIKYENKKISFRLSSEVIKQNIEIFLNSEKNKNMKLSDAQKWYELSDDTSENKTDLIIGGVTIFPVWRTDKMGLRIKDVNSLQRKNFSGRKWFAPNGNFIIQAKWTSYEPEREIIIPNILGQNIPEKAPGFATFTIDGQEVTLTPTKEGDSLFFVFKDATSGKETYGAARFLSSALPQNNTVTLDFNKSVNPPCAFTAFATCPLPPNENRLKVAISAGEMTPAGH
jgi:uncharacterized protein (DUF1684 family)